MKKAKRKSAKVSKVDKVSKGPAQEANTRELDSQDDFGGIPMRDLKKNLGCG
jgi:hypothetical protein